MSEHHSQYTEARLHADQMSTAAMEAAYESPEKAAAMAAAAQAQATLALAAATMAAADPDR